MSELNDERTESRIFMAFQHQADRWWFQWLSPPTTTTTTTMTAWYPFGAQIVVVVNAQLYRRTQLRVVGLNATGWGSDQDWSFFDFPRHRTILNFPCRCQMAKKALSQWLKKYPWAEKQYMSQLARNTKKKKQNIQAVISSFLPNWEPLIIMLLLLLLSGADTKPSTVNRPGRTACWEGGFVDWIKWNHNCRDDWHER